MSNRPEQVEPPADPIKVERVGGLSRPPLRIVALIALVVGVGVVKPWELGRPSPEIAPFQGDIARAVASATVRPTPTVDPVLDAASGRLLCNAPSVWRLISAETSVLGDSRTMYGIDPVTAAGPTDPQIPTAQLDATHMYGLGVCRPNPGGTRVPDLPFNAVTIWREDDPTQPLAVLQPRILSDSMYRLGEVYFGPPGAYPLRSSDASSRPSWQPGRYVIEIVKAAPRDKSLWFALDFSNISGQAGGARVH